MVDIPLDRSRRATAFLPPFIASALRHGGWLAVFLVLAPVIGPRGYGLFMLALGGVAIAEALLAGTMTQALLGLDTVEERHWSTALMTMIAGGGAVWLALRAAAPWLDTLVAEPGFPDMFQSLAILPLLGGLSVVPVAALRREGRERAITAANIAGFAAGAGAALSLATAGAGAWSLVAQIIVQRLVECVVLWATPGERIGLAWSARHFTEIAEAMDGRAPAAVWPAVRRYAPCLVVGLALGPTAAGLYMLAMIPAEAIAEIALAGAKEATPRALVSRAGRVMLPAVLASGLLAIALPPLIDLRWWGAVPPAQLLVLGAIPAAIVSVCRHSAAGNTSPGLLAIEAVGGIALVALLARDGLVAMAAGNLVWLSVVALAGLWRARQLFPAPRRDLLRELLRPVGGAALAGLFLWFFAPRVGLSLTAVSALSLLSGAAWLIYLVVRGDPQHLAARREAVG